MGVAELDNETRASYDVVMSSLCFSELNENERAYALGEAYRLLRPDGRLLLAECDLPVLAMQAGRTRFSLLSPNYSRAGHQADKCHQAFVDPVRFPAARSSTNDLPVSFPNSRERS